MAPWTAAPSTPSPRGRPARAGLPCSGSPGRVSARRPPRAQVCRGCGARSRRRPRGRPGADSPLLRSPTEAPVRAPSRPRGCALPTRSSCQPWVVRRPQLGHVARGAETTENAKKTLGPTRLQGRAQVRESVAPCARGHAAAAGPPVARKHADDDGAALAGPGPGSCGGAWRAVEGVDPGGGRSRRARHQPIGVLVGTRAGQGAEDRGGQIPRRGARRRRTLIVELDSLTSLSPEVRPRAARR